MYVSSELDFHFFMKYINLGDELTLLAFYKNIFKTVYLGRGLEK